MTRAFDGFMPVSRLTSVLCGGKAPACWWRGIVQKAARLVAMRRDGVWVQEFGDIHPRLCEYPLLGYTLTTLTRQTEPTQEAPPETTRSGKEKPSQWASPLQPARNGAATGNPIVAQHRTAKPIQPAVAKHKAASAQALCQIKTQADRLLLSRLAEGKLSFDNPLPVPTNSFSARAKSSEAGYGDLANQQDWLSRLAQRAGRAGVVKLTHNNVQMPSFQEQWAMFNQSVSAHGKRSDAFFPPLYGDSATQQDWLNRLVQRTGRAGIQKQPNTAGTANLAQNNIQIPDHSPSLQEQWAMPLNGMCASMELLNRLVQDDLPDRERDNGRAGQYQAQASLKPDGFSAGWFGESLSGSNKLKANAPPPMTAGEGFPELNIHEQLAYGESKTKSSAPVMPPRVTVSLPNLLPPQQAGTQPLPVAAATVRQGTRTEELNAADDLDMLAAKINQILNEQARRHGIDV